MRGRQKTNPQFNKAFGQSLGNNRIAESNFNYSRPQEAKTIINQTAQRIGECYFSNFNLEQIFQRKHKALRVSNLGAKKVTAEVLRRHITWEGRKTPNISTSTAE